MRILKSAFLLLFFFTILTAHTQELPRYTLQIGTFVKPKPAKFENLKTFGFLYAKPRGEDLFDVRMGGYSSQNAANEVAASIQNATGENVQVVSLNVDGGAVVTVIQIATKQGNRAFDWTPYLEIDNLYVLLENGTVKIVVGGFKDEINARNQLEVIRSRGFPGAFPKNVNNVLLHKIGGFELGNEKRPLIPLDFKEKTSETIKFSKQKETAITNEIKEEESKVSEKKITTPPPSSIKFDNKPATAKEVITKKSPVITYKTVILPKINGKMKRGSALRLQEVLKSSGLYKGSLDGYYGDGTKAAFNAAKIQSRQIKKYKILANNQFTVNQATLNNDLQFAINQLWEDALNANSILEKSANPLAKAYRAYYLFEAEGMDGRVNELMNTAIKEAFNNATMTNLPKFNYEATYAYNDINQLLLHLRYIHEVSDGDISVPCWLFDQNAAAAQSAFATAGNIAMQNCSPFLKWEDLQILYTIATDLSLSTTPKNTSSELSKLFFNPIPEDAETVQGLKDWEKKLWQGIDGWSLKDPILAEITEALKIEYYQSQILLEEHFMEQGLKDNDAKGLALVALKAMIGEALKRFV